MSQIQLPSSKWYDQLVETLETRGATPQQVSDAVATVHSHCLEANRPPEIVFGDAREYARQLSSERPSTLPRRWSDLAFSCFLCLCFLGPSGAKHLFNDGPGVNWYFTGVSLLVLVPPVARSLMAVRGASSWLYPAIGLPPTIVALYALYRWGWDSPTPAWVWLPILVIALVVLPISLWQSWRSRVTDPTTGREFALTTNSTSSMVLWMVVLLTGYFAVMLASIYLF